jgi:6-phosphogluconolactonase
MKPPESGACPEILVGDEQHLAAALAREFEDCGKRAIAGHEHFIVAIPGGSVASTFFPRLSKIPINWSGTEFFFVDERAVPPSDPDSNYGLARSLWFEPAKVPPAQVHRMAGEGQDLSLAALAYARTLRMIAGDPPRLDFVLLGVGSDGHVASLFPTLTGAANTRDLVAVVENAPKPPPRRLTLTMSVLAAAERLVVIAMGVAKAAIIHEALHEESGLPLASVLRQSRNPWVLLDPEAASRL